MKNLKVDRENNRENWGRGVGNWRREKDYNLTINSDQDGPYGGGYFGFLNKTHKGKIDLNGTGAITFLKISASPGISKGKRKGKILPTKKKKEKEGGKAGNIERLGQSGSKSAKHIFEKLGKGGKGKNRTQIKVTKKRDNKPLAEKWEEISSPAKEMQKEKN